MQHSRLVPPGARAPLVVLVVALAAGAVMFVRVHQGVKRLPSASGSIPPVSAVGPSASVHERVPR